MKLLPRIYGWIDCLRHVKILSPIVANSGYRRSKVHERDHEKTMLTAHHRLYQSSKMLFEARNVRASFKRAMDVIQSGGKWRYTLVYLGECFILSRRRREHVKHTEMVFMASEVFRSSRQV